MSSTVQDSSTRSASFGHLTCPLGADLSQCTLRLHLGMVPVLPSWRSNAGVLVYVIPAQAPLKQQVPAASPSASGGCTALGPVVGHAAAAPAGVVASG